MTSTNTPPATWRAIVTWTHPTPLSPDDFEALVLDLPGYGVVTQNLAQRTLTIGLTVAAPDLHTAIERALAIADNTFAFDDDLATSTGEPVEIRVLRDEAWAHELAHPGPLDLVSSAEAGAILCVSKQRVQQLKGTHETFPAPVARSGGADLWTRSSIEAFAETDWQLKPGRPAKETPDA